MKSIWNWLIVFVVFVVLMLAANFFLPEGADTLDFTGLAWIVWALLAVVGVYVVYFFTKDSDAWVIGTREVVYMGIGAALYGIFAFLFNGSVIALPSISLISYRPAMAILVFFGYVFGPVVGFFTGAVGNILGDFLSGWGVYPTWDIGNGLIGFVAGLPLLFMNREKSINVLTWIAGLLVLVSTGFILLNANTEDPYAWRGITDFGPYAWVLLIGGVLALLTRFLMTRLGEGTALMNLWAVIGIVVGIGYAAIGDIWISGYTFVATMVGQFAPAVSWNIIFAVILAPLLLVAYNAVQQRAGR